MGLICHAQDNSAGSTALGCESLGPGRTIYLVQLSDRVESRFYPAKDGDLLATRAPALRTLRRTECARYVARVAVVGGEKQLTIIRPIVGMVASHWLNSPSRAGQTHSALTLLLAWSSPRAPDSWAPPSSPSLQALLNIYNIILLSRYCLVCSSNVCGVGRRRLSVLSPN